MFIVLKKIDSHSECFFPTCLNNCATLKHQPQLPIGYIYPPPPKTKKNTFVGQLLTSVFMVSSEFSFAD